MINYYIVENDKIVLHDTDKQKLVTTLGFMPQYKDFEIFETEDWIIDGEIMTQEEYEAELAKKEHEHIQELSMTRSDFFDGTIKAFGAGQEELLLAIEAVLTGLKIADVEKKIALNNYKNALNFYRKHPLFTMLSDVEIPLGEGLSIVITSEQWDKFFDETDKGNEEAYKELLPLVKEEPEEIELADDIIISSDEKGENPPVSEE